jgi:hypothetical protein
MPTQVASAEVPVGLTCGTFHDPLAEVKVPPVAIYPAQLLEIVRYWGIAKDSGAPTRITNVRKIYNYCFPVHILFILVLFFV